MVPNINPALYRLSYSDPWTEINIRIVHIFPNISSALFECFLSKALQAILMYFMI